MKSVNEKIYFFLNRHGMSQHFSMWQKQNITILVLLFFLVNGKQINWHV